MLRLKINMVRLGSHILDPTDRVCTGGSAKQNLHSLFYVRSEEEKAEK